MVLNERNIILRNEILVSIICNTYNHENYIADAIESFLMQKTNFKYEIMIHDDASTDKTAEIVKKYEAKYPDIIKPIYQKENQYSKGIKVDILNGGRAVGKYHALCEGDDYWTDPYKLQKQADFLEANSDYSLCVHAATVIDAIAKRKISNMRPSNANRDFSTEDIIYGGGGIFATNSMFYRRIKTEIIPDFFNKASVGDYPLIIYLSLIGKIYYIDEFMSVYRYAVPGSWSVRTSSNIKNGLRHNDEISNMLDELNIYTDHVYNSIIEKTRIRYQFQLMILQGKVKEAKTGKFFEYYSALSIKSKVSIHLRKYCPHIYKMLKKVEKVLLDAKSI